MGFIAVVAIITGMMFCAAMAVTGWMSWRDTHKWQFLAGSGFYLIATIAIGIWLL